MAICSRIMDLNGQTIVGWSCGDRMTKELVLDVCMLRGIELDILTGNDAL